MDLSPNAWIVVAVVALAIVAAIVVMMLPKRSRARRPVAAARQPAAAAGEIPLVARFDAVDDEGEVTRLAASVAPTRGATADEDAGYEESIATASKPVVRYELGSPTESDDPPGTPDRFGVRAAGRTDKGVVRRRNDDAFLVDPRIGLFVVADGMGGHADGDLASQLAVDEIVAGLHADVPESRAAPADLPPRARTLVAAIERANAAVHEAARRQRKVMGATVVAARVSPRSQRLYVAHAGDCRAYRLREGVCRQLTADHTLGAAGVEGPRASRVCRAIGAAPTIAVDVFVDAPLPEDVYLFCSDGLFRMLADVEIARVLAEHRRDPEKAALTLTLAANAAGGRDNVTVVVLAITSPA